MTYYWSTLPVYYTEATELHQYSITMVRHRPDLPAGRLCGCVLATRSIRRAANARGGCRYVVAIVIGRVAVVNRRTITT